MKITYHVYKDYSGGGSGSSDEEIFEKSNEDVRRNRYSFVSMCRPPASTVLYIGTTHAMGDLLVAFDTEKKAFSSCGYAEGGAWERTEHKIHKGMWFDEAENAIYFGTSTLSHHRDLIVSPGGALAVYDCGTGEVREIARPTRGDYYQATCYDPARRKIYMYTMPGSCFAIYDLEERRLVRKDPMESIPHIGAIDDDGGVWGTYGAGTQAFFRYDPDTDTYEFPDGCAFSNAFEAANIMYPGAGPVDSMINGRDGFLYAASALGEFFMIDPRTKEVTFLGKPFTGKRLPGMCLGDDGCIYLAGGNDGAPRLARYDREEKKFEFLGPIVAEDGTACYRCHELHVVGDTAYIGETDNNTRSGYLWECAF